jgi:hypothetical protein
MALALNVFKTITSIASTNPIGIYTAPVGYTGVVLMAQITNVSPNSHDVTFIHERTNVGIAVSTRMLKSHPIAGNDTLDMLTGKLVLEPGDKLVLSASTETHLEFIGSILETLN